MTLEPPWGVTVSFIPRENGTHHLQLGIRKLGAEVHPPSVSPTHHPSLSLQEGSKHLSVTLAVFC